MIQDSQKPITDIELIFQLLDGTEIIGSSKIIQELRKGSGNRSKLKLLETITSWQKCGKIITIK